MSSLMLPCKPMIAMVTVIDGCKVGVVSGIMVSGQCLRQPARLHLVIQENSQEASCRNVPYSTFADPLCVSYAGTGVLMISFLLVEFNNV